MVSIIVPAYNASKTIKKCIESLLRQNYRNIEVIIVNDGSTDSTYDICVEIAKEDNRIKLYNIKNCGVSYARNYGLKKANGDYIQFVDADDYVLPQYTYDMVKHIQKFDVDLVISGYLSKKGDTESLINAKLQTGLYKKNDILQVLYASNALLNSPWNKLYKRNLIKDEFNCTLSLGEDLIFNITYCKNIANLYFLAWPLYVYVKTSDTLTTKYRFNMVMDISSLYMQIKDTLGEDQAGKTFLSNIHDTICVLMKSKVFRYNNKQEELYRIIEYVQRTTNITVVLGKKAVAPKYKLVFNMLKGNFLTIGFWCYYFNGLLRKR